MSLVHDEEGIQLYLGDNKEEIKNVPDQSVDLIVTSPPYADARKDTYGGVAVDKYIEWFLPLSSELFRVLKPTGSFILNIKEKVVNKERSTYVMELIMALRGQGFKWVDEFIWAKPNATPGKWSNRFRDAWERCIHLTKQTTGFHMYQDEVKEPASESYIKSVEKLKRLSKEVLGTRKWSATGSGVNIKFESVINKDRTTVYPDNVLHYPMTLEEIVKDWSQTNLDKMLEEWESSVAFKDQTKALSKDQSKDALYQLPSNVLELSVAGSDRKHSAVFPESLPKWFIKLFTKPGDLVLEPFAGSGTTLKMARLLGRRCVGFEIMKDYVPTILARIRENESQNLAVQDDGISPKQNTFF